jgi:hypothetical protein
MMSEMNFLSPETLLYSYMSRPYEQHQLEPANFSTHLSGDSPGTAHG